VPTPLPTYIFVLLCVNVRVVFLSDDGHFGCILSFKCVGSIFLGEKLRWVLHVYDASMLIILNVCKLLQF
jgi:hypothetical protein